MRSKIKTIVVANTKGSVGKTPLSLNIAYDLDFKIQTNDISALMMTYKTKTKLVSKFTYEENTVYDMGGFTAESVLDIISKTNKLIVPVNNDPSSLIHTFTCLKQFEQKAKEIIIVITKTEKTSEFRYVKKEINKRFKNNNFKFFEMPLTKSFTATLKKGKSLNHLVKNNNQFRIWWDDYNVRYYLPFLKEVKGKS